MTPSSAALQLARQSEGLRLTAYRDETGRLTIGYGHAEGVQAGQTITEEEAEQLLVDDMDEAGAEVSRLVTVPLAQGQFDALCDFVFNLGAGRLLGSTLLRVLNRADYGAAAAQFKYWCMANGHPEPGLVARRQAETILFNATPSGAAA